MRTARYAVASFMLALCGCSEGQYTTVVIPDGHGLSMGEVFFAEVENEVFWTPSDAHPNATAALYQGQCGALTGLGRDVSTLRYSDPSLYLGGGYAAVATDATDSGCANVP